MKDFVSVEEAIEKGAKRSICKRIYNIFLICLRGVKCSKLNTLNR
jgi:hypothetical protein